MLVDTDIVNEVSLRKATKTDIPYLYALYKEEIPTNSWKIEDFYSFLEQKVNLALCIMLKKKCVGFIMLTIIVPESDLINVAVQKPLQNMGIGKEAMYCLDKLLKGMGIKNIYLEVRKSSRALNFYTLNGFNITGYRKDYYEDHEDAVSMEKSI